MAYSKAQLEALWAATNPGNGDPHLMAAIALAESSGNPSSLNSIGACGLWQIHPYEAGCLSPTTNARMAGGKLKSQGLTAWETYTNGAYKQYYTGVSSGGTIRDAGLLEDIAPGLGGPVEKFLGEGKTTSPGETFGELGENPLGASPLTGGTSGVLGGLGEIDKVLSLLTSTKGWVRIGKVLVGIFLLLAGVMGMANIDSSPVVKAGKKAAELGVAAAA
jgi:Transglycosylase SLT domain